MVRKYLLKEEYDGERNYTGMTSIFDVSSHLKIIPSRLTGNIHLAHWHPVVKGSGGGTIISTFSFLWTTPITLTVLPSLMYLQKEQWKSHKNILPTYPGSPLVPNYELCTNTQIRHTKQHAMKNSCFCLCSTTIGKDLTLTASLYTNT